MARPRSRFRSRARRGGKSGVRNVRSSTRDSSEPRRDATPISLASRTHPNRATPSSSVNLFLQGPSSSTHSVDGRQPIETSKSDPVHSRSAPDTTSNSRQVSTTTPISISDRSPDGNRLPSNRGPTLDHASTNREATSTSSAVDHMPNPDSIDEFDNEIVMALDIRSQATIGCAYYVAREERLYFMQDCKFGVNSIIDIRTSHRQFGILVLILF